ncbi:MAG: hypothetical protein UCP83_17265 [Intestinibacter bartlettii]|nr:hypothetical protein [Intestinibacter bartlettii]
MNLYNEMSSLFERKHSPIENKIKAMENLLGYSISSELRECLNKEIEKLKIRLDISQEMQIDILNKILEYEKQNS